MELILHHYDDSSFAEKVRLVLGLKGLAWRSVEIPAWAPKPDYTPLTAGYRRTRALQVGADVYCERASSSLNWSAARRCPRCTRARPRRWRARRAKC